MRDLLDDVAGTEPVPAAGSVTAATLALAAALTAKAAHRSRRADARDLAGRADALREQVEPIVTADAETYATALAASPERRATLLREASRGPLTVAVTAAEVAELAAELAHAGNPNLRYDAAAASRLAASAARVAASLAAANDGSDAEVADAASASERAAVCAGRAEQAASGSSR